MCVKAQTNSGARLCCHVAIYSEDPRVAIDVEAHCVRKTEYFRAMVLDKSVPEFQLGAREIIETCLSS